VNLFARNKKGGEIFMTLKEHYKFHSRQSMKPYTKLFILIIFVITIFHTLGRYTSNATLSSIIQIASWSISINEQIITSHTNSITQTINLVNVSNESNYIEAGDECYFDITIDPTGTDVSLTYSITIDLTSGTNPLPSGTVIEKYDIYTGSELILTSSNNTVGTASTTISGGCSLNNGQALSSESIKKYRIYCLVPNEASITQNQMFKVNPVMSIQQEIL